MNSVVRPAVSVNFRDSSMDGACCNLLKDIEQRLAESMVGCAQSCTSPVDKFIKEIFANITDDNILTEEEWQEWQALKAEGNYIDCNDSPVNLCEDPEVLTKNISLMEQEISENLFEEYGALEWQLNEELKDLVTLVNKLKKETLKCKKDLEDSFEKYKQTADDAYAASIQVVDGIPAAYNRIVTDQHLCNMPLSDLKHKFYMFFEAFETHLESHFREVVNDDHLESCKKFLFEQRMVEKSLSKTIHDNTLLECELQAQQAALSHLKEMKSSVENCAVKPSFADIESELALLKSSKTIEDIVADFKDDLVSFSQKTANIKTLKKTLSMCHSKYNRVNYWLSQTEKWTDCMKSERKLIGDILGVLQSEEEEARNFLMFIKEFEMFLRGEHDKAVCRMASMQTRFQQPTKNELQNVLRNVLSQFLTNNDIAFESLQKELKRIAIDMKTSRFRKENIFLQSLKDTKNIVFENDCFFKIISGLKTTFEIESIHIDLPGHQLTLTEFEQALHEIENDFTKKQSVISTNYFVKHRRLLWVYILCNHKQLAEVLSYMNACLARASK